MIPNLFFVISNVGGAARWKEWLAARRAAVSEGGNLCGGDGPVCGGMHELVWAAGAGLLILGVGKNDILELARARMKVLS
jgi:hypothetical protein